MAEVQMVPVNSSHVRAIGYDPDARELTVRFDNGAYRYSGVEPEIFRAFLDAGSKGKFLEMAIKGKYPYSRV